MGYLIAAYAIVFLGFVGYHVWLGRRRSQLIAQIEAHGSGTGRESTSEGDR
jgi:CcmD family protein